MNLLDLDVELLEEFVGLVKVHRSISINVRLSKGIHDPSERVGGQGLRTTHMTIDNTFNLATSLCQLELHPRFLKC